MFMEHNTFLDTCVRASPFQTVVFADIVELAVGLGIITNGWTRDRLREYATSLFGSWGQRKVIEDHFQILRHRETAYVKHNINLPLVYESMATEMGGIVLHNRDHVYTTALPAQYRARDRFSTF